MDADMSSACLVSNGCGWYRDTQSMVFFSAPGMEKLYSGEAMTMACASSSLLAHGLGAGREALAAWWSASYEGVSKSLIRARSTVCAARGDHALGEGGQPVVERAGPQRRAEDEDPQRGCHAHILPGHDGRQDRSDEPLYMDVTSLVTF
jgi:hypothetical protein